jgi:multiple antibiotic resistance protein
MFETGLFTLFLKFFVALVALSNPFWGVPVFLSLTTGYTPEERRRTALIAPCAVAATAILTLLLGKSLLAFFGIHVPSFRIAGGIIILLMALAMLSTSTDEPARRASEHGPRRNIAVVPLAVPYLAGPGVITTIIVFAHNLHGVADYVTVILAIVLVALILWVGLRFAEPMAGLMGKSGMEIVSRIMAVLLAAIAIEMVLVGVDQHYPNFHGGTAASVPPAASSAGQ